MLTSNLIKSELSVAYVHAIAAKCGIASQTLKIDQDSADVKLRMKTPKGFRKITELDLQLKATSVSMPKSTTDSFPFDLSIKNYNDLRANRHTPALLVILLLPSDENSWLKQSAQKLTLKKCAYWYNLKGEPEILNQSKVRIHVPLSQIFSPEQLLLFMGKISNVEEI